MNTPKKIHGLLLAGGRSSRMGKDKASLVHPDGRTLLMRCREMLLKAGCESVLVSLRQDQEIPVGLEASEIVRDPAGESRGPMVGIVTGMRLHPEDHWLVLACDLPRLDVATLENLIRSRREDETFLSYRSEFDDLPEPLCALYASGSLATLEQAVAEDFRCPRKILIRNDCRMLEAVTPRALENANTPEEWKTAIIQ
jgi:molybdopterin-guanine dinucleotide biosynthesis protein A